MSSREHKGGAPRRVDVAVLTVSTSRGLSEDQSGAWICRQAEKEGHRVVCRRRVPDDKEAIARAVREVIEALHPHLFVVTGGTGIAAADVTVESLRPMMRKELTAFSTLFALLSFRKVDSAAILSRAAAGVVGETAVFCLPGSLEACKLACRELIFPEAGHLARHLGEG
jgi:molybdenum cofactor biosynthesis protein B